jgi:transposase InsO family protein
LALGVRVDYSIGTADVMTELEQLFAKPGKPKIICCDKAREFISSPLKSRLAGRGIAIAYMEKGQPQQNCFVERFNGTMRREARRGRLRQRAGGADLCCPSGHSRSTTIADLIEVMAC